MIRDPRHYRDTAMNALASLVGDDGKERFFARITERIRQVPLVFRISGALLLAALIIGQFMQRQPAGSWTHKLITSAARACPSAAFRGKRATVADGAYALDRAVYWRVADNYLPATPSRCTAL